MRSSEFNSLFQIGILSCNWQLTIKIKTNYTDMYKSASWKYLEYLREIFDYIAGKVLAGVSYIESPRNKNKTILGETAVLDV